MNVYENSIVKIEKDTWTLEAKTTKKGKEYRLFTLVRDGLSVFEILRNSNGMLTVNFGTEGKTCVRLLGRLDDGTNTIRVVNLGVIYQLIINGVLADEDYPLKNIDINGTECRQNLIDASLRFEKAERMLPFTVGEVTTIEKLAHDSENCYFGDCMPFWHDGVYHLFYLYDRRRHGSKCGYGGHIWAHISTTDLVNWKRHEHAVTIDDFNETSFRTGSVVYWKGLFYAFYVIRMPDGIPSPIAYSVSDDGEHFVKSKNYFYLDERYDNKGLRDPNVFIGEDGRLNMFLTTKIMSPDNNHKGCILHLTADDVDFWSIDEEPFLTVDINEYPECSDYFYMNGRYYFSYCIFSVSHYMISDKPLSGFEYVPEQLLGGNGFVVPKTARFFDRRIAAGFSWVPYFAYAGDPVFLEIFTNDDGTLRFEVPQELL